MVFHSPMVFIHANWITFQFFLPSSSTTSTSASLNSSTNWTCHLYHITLDQLWWNAIIADWDIFIFSRIELRTSSWHLFLGRCWANNTFGGFHLSSKCYMRMHLMNSPICCVRRNALLNHFGFSAMRILLIIMLSTTSARVWFVMTAWNHSIWVKLS